MRLTTDEFYNLPIYVRNTFIPTRFFLAPINTGYTVNGSPTNSLINFHTLHSGNKIGISYVGNVAISPQFRTNLSTAFFDDNLSLWETVTAAISKKGSLPGIQLGCKVSKIPSMKEWINDNITEYVEAASREFNSYSTSFLEDIVDSYIRAAEISYRCGFKVIQVHAAHGYLLSLSLSSSFNKRNDKYGKDRTLLVSNIIERIRSAVPDAVVDVRISLLEGILSPEKEMEEKNDIIKVLSHSGVDIISISSGIYNINKNLIYPKKDSGVGPYVDLVLPFTELYPNIIWNVAGNLYDLNVLQASARKNLTYSIGRSLIADYAFIEKYSCSNVDSIHRCKWCGGCHYYSNDEKSMTPCW